MSSSSNVPFQALSDASRTPDQYFADTQGLNKKRTKAPTSGPNGSVVDRFNSGGTSKDADKRNAKLAQGRIKRQEQIAQEQVSMVEGAKNNKRVGGRNPLLDLSGFSFSPSGLGGNSNKRTLLGG